MSILVAVDKGQLVATSPLCKCSFPVVMILESFPFACNVEGKNPKNHEIYQTQGYCSGWKWSQENSQ